MAKRYIGIDIDSGTVRVAVLTEEKGGARLTTVARGACPDPGEAAAVASDLIGGKPALGDRLAAALPAGESFVRRLRFPFDDAKKIEAALAFELSSQLPVNLDEYLADFRKPVPDGEGGFIVTAAAVGRETIRQRVEPFDRGTLPLHILDLAPFAFAAGLRSSPAESILVVLGAEENSVSLVRGGQVADYRLLPSRPDQPEGELVRLIRREGMALQRAAGLRELPFILIGAGAEALRHSLGEAGVPAEVPELSADGRPADPAYLPAVALARRAALGEKEKEMNFRRGPFVLKGEWESLKKKLIATGILLLLSGLVVAGSAYFTYALKAGRAEALREEMTEIFRATFSGSRAIVDIPLQMESRIGELRKRARLIGVGRESSPLLILQEISRKLPADLSVDVRELAYGSDSVRLEGVTGSFDAINRMARSLGESTLFKEAQITDAKMSIDGSKVDFRLNLILTGGGNGS